MSFVGSGNINRHHDYKICPKCNKKGFYKPYTEITRDGKQFMDFPKQCRYCDYSEGEMKFVNANAIKCCICGNEIEKVDNWNQGNNAEPVAKGRCCNYCNESVVIPARLERLI